MLKILISSIVGTSFMTAYSYWKAKKQQEQFEEPIMLGKLLHRSYPEKISPRSSRIQGWIIHYTIGSLFNIGYDQVWKRSPLRPGTTSGVLLGGVSALIGMATWATILCIHSDPPRTNLKNHLKQLFTAHIIFGVTSALVYRQLQHSKLRKNNE